MSVASYGYSYHTFPYEKFGYTYEMWHKEPLTHILTLKVNRRIAHHDCYNEDVGEFEFAGESYRIVGRLALYIEEAGLSYVQAAFDSDELGCVDSDMFGCNHNGQVRVLSVATRKGKRCDVTPSGNI